MFFLIIVQPILISTKSTELNFCSTGCIGFADTVLSFEHHQSCNFLFFSTKIYVIYNNLTFCAAIKK